MEMVVAVHGAVVHGEAVQNEGVHDGAVQNAPEAHDGVVQNAGAHDGVVQNDRVRGDLHVVVAFFKTSVYYDRNAV